jgi:uncharacterized damage-inducible protein DinB
MKLLSRTITMSVLALLLTHATAFAQGGRRGGGPPAITTLSGDILADWQAQKEMIVDAADAMPADKFTYKSTPAQRDFAAQIMHIVQTNGFLLMTLKGKTPPPMINMQATSKADVVNALRQSYDYGEKLLQEFNDAQFNERVAPPPFMGPSASRIRLVYGIMQHTNDIYGQMVVYLRLNGIVPPASRRGGV